MDSILTKPATIKSLSKPQLDGENALLKIIQARKSTREYSDRPIPEQVLSNLLWAAFGVSRPETGLRTTPTARNYQEIDVYVAMAEGLYLYHAVEHQLELVLDEDVRALTGMQDFTGIVPVNLIYVSDPTRLDEEARKTADAYSPFNVGFIGENVYLYCVTEGLATVVRGAIDRKVLAHAMHLRPDQRILLAQTVGYPAES
jgi:nitroreductase